MSLAGRRETPFDEGLRLGNDECGEIGGGVDPVVRVADAIPGWRTGIAAPGKGSTSAVTGGVTVAILRNSSPFMRSLVMSSTVFSVRVWPLSRISGCDGGGGSKGTSCSVTARFRTPSINDFHMPLWKIQFTTARRERGASHAQKSCYRPAVAGMPRESMDLSPTSGIRSCLSIHPPPSTLLPSYMTQA